ncbi:hypothetical protein BsWGS_10561 [Bradybaena similaris]
MMSISKYIPRICSHFQATANFFHSNRVLRRKHYDYDLDSLIEWKKETARVFGSVRKPTKTGKLKKTKKGLDPQMGENLQIMSTLSMNKENFSDIEINAAVKKGKKVKNSVACSNIADDNLIPDLPSLCTTETFVHGGKIRDAEVCSLQVNSFDIPDDVFMMSLVPPVKQIWDEDVYSGESEKAVTFDKVSKDEIIIPKLSPIPSCDSGSTHKFTKSLLKNNASPTTSSVLYAAITDGSDEFVDHSIETIETINLGDMTTNAGASTVQMTEPASSSLGNTKSRKTTKSSSSKSKVAIVSQVLFKDNLNKELVDAEIFIPKLKPIPGKTLTGATLNLSVQPTESAVSSPQSSLLESALSPPIEPPESFEIIVKVPLFPMENSKWQNGVDSHLFEAFKMDIEQMCLNVLPSVKTILSKTMPDLNRFFLNRWREGMINELGEEGFKKHQEATIRNGLNLHANIMEWLSGKQVNELQIMPDNEGHWSSLQTALNAISDVRAVEVEISHNLLNYRGVFDCLARHKDVLCMIDWKTSKKPRPLLKNTYDDPLQIAAYMGALNASEIYVKKYGEVNHGMVVVVYPDGSPAHIHIMDKSTCEKHWVQWTERLYNFYQLTYTEKMAANRDRIQAKKKLFSSGTA